MKTRLLPLAVLAATLCAGCLFEEDRHAGKGGFRDAERDGFGMDLADPSGPEERYTQHVVPPGGIALVASAPRPIGECR